MSESLLFAILGFLIACLFGTVFASFLWRRAVKITTRKITQDENFADLGEVADLKADLRATQNSLATKDREIGDAQARTSELEAAVLEAQTSGEGTAENLRQELQDAATALEAANKERDTAKAALSAKDAEIKEAKERVSVLENAIRTLAKEAALFDKDAKGPEATAPTKPTVAAQTTTSQEPQSAGASNIPATTPPTSTPTGAKPTPAKPDSSEKDDLGPSQAVSRSLEERIEALKQGETSSA